MALGDANSNNRNGIEPLFTDYSKITDTLMWFSRTVALRLSVQLIKKNDNLGRNVGFHSSAKFYSDYLGMQTYTIKRNFATALIIDNLDNWENSIKLNMGDVNALQHIFQYKIFGWFLGDTSIFKIGVDNKLALKDVVTVQVPISETAFLQFSPIIVEFEDGREQQGLRMYMNDYEHFVDMTLDKFYEFDYYIRNVDLHNAALSMINYVSNQTQHVNLHDMTERKDNFFNKGTSD